MNLEEENQIKEEARTFFCGYQLCIDMLNLRKYERKRVKPFDEACVYEDILKGDESYWKARVYEVASLLGSMKSGREKSVLYYRYVRGETMESTARLLGISRRTAFRLRGRGLLSAGILLRKRREEERLWQIDVPQ